MKKFKMQNFKNALFGLLLITIIMFSSCRDCCIKPDLISDLATPTTDIIRGEPVDWDYVIESVEDNSQECDILKAVASIGKIIVDFFVDEKDEQGAVVFEQQSNVNALMGGQSQNVTSTIDAFSEKGIYLVTVNADDIDDVDEREENNNFSRESEEVGGRSAAEIDLFQNASAAFKKKLSTASAIVIVGRKFDEKNKINFYKGKPIYYAK